MDTACLWEGGPRDSLGFFGNRGNLLGLERHGDPPQVKDGDDAKSINDTNVGLALYHHFR